MSNHDDKSEWHSRYLHFWQTTIKQEKEAKITLYNDINVKGKIIGMDSQANRFCVQDMETPNSGLNDNNNNNDDNH
ncbi:hypothetical protein INT45_011252 [Circinella minor]|uniref:Uncharacterized protein n=1 Tax=Circinella minor TaxID=1195481 RepID=A0A8H7RWY4_9FUNG|nr:hypothetical protein INT45_011252 [Circinella minor]